MNNKELIDRLRLDLTKSMFANAADMREDIEDQRRLAADALERAEAELAKRDRLLESAVDAATSMIRVADRSTDEFDKGRAFLSAYVASKKESP